MTNSTPNIDIQTCDCTSCYFGKPCHMVKLNEATFAPDMQYLMDALATSMATIAMSVPLEDQPDHIVRTGAGQVHEIILKNFGQSIDFCPDHRFCACFINACRCRSRHDCFFVEDPIQWSRDRVFTTKAPLITRGYTAEEIMSILAESNEKAKEEPLFIALDCEGQSLMPGQRPGDKATPLSQYKGPMPAPPSNRRVRPRSRSRSRTPKRFSATAPAPGQTKTQAALSGLTKAYHNARSRRWGRQRKVRRGAIGQADDGLPPEPIPGFWKALKNLPGEILDAVRGVKGVTNKLNSFMDFVTGAFNDLKATFVYYSGAIAKICSILFSAAIWFIAYKIFGFMAGTVVFFIIDTFIMPGQTTVVRTLQRWILQLMGASIRGIQDRNQGPVEMTHDWQTNVDPNQTMNFLRQHFQDQSDEQAMMKEKEKLLAIAKQKRAECQAAWVNRTDAELEIIATEAAIRNYTTVIKPGMSNEPPAAMAAAFVLPSHLENPNVIPEPDLVDDDATRAFANLPTNDRLQGPNALLYAQASIQLNQRAAQQDFTGMADEMRQQLLDDSVTSRIAIGADGESESLFDDVIQIFCDLFSCAKGAFTKERLLFINAAFVAIRSFTGVLRFLFDFLPEFAQAGLVTMFPGAANYVIFNNSGWHTILAKVEANEKLLNDHATQRVVEEANVIYKECLEFVKRHYKEAFIGKVEARIAAYKVNIERGHLTMLSKTGQAPFFVYISGLPRIGKSAFGRSLAKILAANFDENHEIKDNDVFTVGDGEFPLEGNKNEPIHFYDELFGSTMQTNQKQAELVMKYGSAAKWKPVYANLEAKGGEMLARGVVGCANRAFPFGIDGFLNYGALFARRDALIHTEIDPACKHLSQFPSTSKEHIPAIMAYLAKNMTKEDWAEGIHLRHRFLDPLAALRANYNPDSHEFFKPSFVSSTQTWYTTEQLITVLIDGANRKSAAGIVESDASKLLVERMVGRLPKVAKPAEPTPEEKEVSNTWAMIAKITSYAGPVLAIAGAIELLFHFRQSKKNGAEGEYGDRTRDKGRLLPSTAIARKPTAIQAQGQTGEPDRYFVDGIYRQTAKIIGPDGQCCYGVFLDCETLVTVRHILLGEDGKLKTGEVFEVQYRYGEEILSTYETIDALRVSGFTNKFGTEDVVIMKLSSKLRGVTRFDTQLIAKSVKLPLNTEVIRHTWGLNTIGLYQRDIDLMTYSVPQQCVAGKIKNVRSCTYIAPSEKGDCGAPIFAKIDGMYKLLGIHVAKLAGEAFFIRLSREDVPVSTAPTFLTAVDAMGEGLFPKILTPGPVRRPLGVFASEGKLKRPLSLNTKNAYKIGIRHRDFPVRVRPSKLDPASAWIQEEKSGKPLPSWPEVPLRFGVEVAKQLFNVPSDLPKRRMTIEEALKDLDPSASVGPIYQLMGLKRKDLFTIDSFGEVTFISPLLQRRVDAIFAMLASDRIGPILFQSDLKNECLTNEKVAAGKVRTFQKCDFAWLVVFKMLNGFCTKAATLNQGRVPSSIGINPHSKDWDILARQVRDFAGPENCRAEDVSCYEGTIGPQVMQAVTEVDNAWYNGVDADLRSKANFSAINKCNVIGDNVFLSVFCMPSGKYDTAADNSKGNVIQDAAIFKMIFPLAQPCDYINNVVFKCYGDDSIGGTKPGVIEHFNLKTKSALIKKMGVILTDSKKSPPDQIKEREHFDEISYLKKNFVFNVEFRAFVPYTPMHKLMDSLAWLKTKNENLTEADKLQALNSALGDAFFYGRNANNGMPQPEWRFDRVREFFGTFVPSLKHRLESWDSLWMRYDVDNSFHGQDYELASNSSFDVLEIVAEGQSGATGSVRLNLNSEGTSSTIPTRSLVNIEGAPTDMITLATKPIRVATVTVTASSSGVLLTLLHPSQTLTAQAAIMAQPSTYSRFGVIIRATPISASFVAGELMGSWDPFGDGTTPLSLQQASQLPYFLCDLSSSKGAQIYIPYQHYVDYFFNNTPDMGCFQLQVLSPLQVPSVGTQTIDVIVEVMFCDWETFVPNQIGLAPPLDEDDGMSFELETVVEGAEGEGNYSSVQQTTTYNQGANSKAGNASTGTEQSATASASVAAGKGNSAAQTVPAGSTSEHGGWTHRVGGRAGYDAPDDEEHLDQPNGHVFNLPVHAGALIRTTCDGPEFTSVLGDFAAEDTGVVPTDFQNRVAEMSFTELLTRFCYLQSYTISPSATAGTLLGSIDMSPWQTLVPGFRPLSGDSIQMSILEWVSTKFVKRRGGIRLRFRVNAPLFQTFTLNFIFRYGLFGAPTGHFLDQLTGQNIEWKVDSENRELFIEIDPVTVHEWLYAPYADIGNTSTVNPPNQQTSYGTLDVYVGSAISGSGSVYTPGPALQVWIAGAEDTQFDEFLPLPNLYWVAPMRREVHGVEGQSGGNTMDEITVQAVALTADEANAQPGISVNNATPEEHQDNMLTRHIGNVWKRPQCLLAQYYTMPVQGYVAVQLPSIFNPAVNSGFVPEVCTLYAGFRGDTIYDIVLDSPRDANPVLNAFVIKTTGTTGFNPNSIAAMVPAVPINGPATDITEVPSRYGFYTHYAPSAALPPTTMMKLPGKMRVTVPFASPNRFAGIPQYSGGDVNTATASPQTNSAWLVVRGLLDQTFTLTLYAQPGDGAKVGIFTGIPPMYLDLLAQLGPNYTNYPGFYFPII